MAPLLAHRPGKGEEYKMEHLQPFHEQIHFQELVKAFHKALFKCQDNLVIYRLQERPVSNTPSTKGRVQSCVPSFGKRDVALMKALRNPLE